MLARCRSLLSGHLGKPAGFTRCCLAAWASSARAACYRMEAASRLLTAGLAGWPLLVFLNDHRIIRKRTEDTIIALHPESIQGIVISQETEV